MEVVCQHWLDPVWHETLLLTVGVLGIVKQSPFKAGRVLRELCRGDLPGEDRGRNVVLAGQALADIGEAGADRGSVADVIARLVQVVQDWGTPAPARRDAGHLLGRLGWEPEGGLDLWVEIQPGPFLYGNRRDRRVVESSYCISAYPVTNRQFARFVEARIYGRRECWSDEGWAWRTGRYDSKPISEWMTKHRPPERRGRPLWWGDERLGSCLCPVTGVSWFEAEAYCRWLTTELQAPGARLRVWRNGQLEIWNVEPGTLLVRLPTKEEWERAVRGTDGREYPWGNEWDRTRLNCAEWWAGRELLRDEVEERLVSNEGREAGPTPTAVATFPEGVNPAGLWDGAGNVLEWTNSRHCEGERAVLRGGAWAYDRSIADCWSGGTAPPESCGSAMGFRVCAVSQQD